jgi:hypothetical protein
MTLGAVSSLTAPLESVPSCGCPYRRPSPMPAEAVVSFLVLNILVILVVVGRSRRRPALLTLGLAERPAPARREPRRLSLPRLVLSKRERRLVRSASGILARFPWVPRPRPIPVYAAAYSQPRLRNHVIMPPATTMQTPQKIG